MTDASRREPQGDGAAAGTPATTPEPRILPPSPYAAETVSPAVASFTVPRSPYEDPEPLAQPEAPRAPAWIAHHPPVTSQVPDATRTGLANTPERGSPEPPSRVNVPGTTVVTASGARPALGRTMAALSVVLVVGVGAALLHSSGDSAPFSGASPSQPSQASPPSSGAPPSAQPPTTVPGHASATSGASPAGTLQAPSGLIPLEFLGWWSGQINQTGSRQSPYDFTVRILQGRLGERVATGTYPSLGCVVTWSLTAAEPREIIVQESVDSGPCGQVEITLTRQSDGRLRYIFQKGVGNGFLRHGGSPR